MSTHDYQGRKELESRTSAAGKRSSGMDGRSSTAGEPFVGSVMGEYAEIGVGLAIIVAGSILKAIFNYSDLLSQVGDKRQIARGEMLFRSLFFAPDVITLSLGLTLSLTVVQQLLAGLAIPTRLGDDFGTAYGALIAWHFIAALTCVLCWVGGGPEKFIPLAPHNRQVPGRISGLAETVSDFRVDIKAGLRMREFWCNLVFANIVAVSTLGIYVLFLSRAF